MTPFKAFPVVICGPSGVGKSTIIGKLQKELDGKIDLSVSHTTRKPRNKEKDGINYYFVDKESMSTAIENGEFLEHATYSGNMYGTSKKAVEVILQENKICVLDIEMQGVKQVKQSDLNPLYIFIKPPSTEELERRLRGRHTETEESVQRRLSIGKTEIEYGNMPGNFDHVFVNDNVDDTTEKILNVLMTEANKV